LVWRAVSLRKKDHVHEKNRLSQEWLNKNNLATIAQAAALECYSFFDNVSIALNLSLTFSSYTGCKP
jgi:hypothetical protein